MIGNTLTKEKNSLSAKLKHKYEVRASIEPSKVASIYDRSDIIVSRGGANTISEIISVRRPAVVIPIPWSYLDEQTKNAELLVKIGLGKILTQNKLSGTTLYRAIQEARKNWENIVRDGTKKTEVTNASANLVDLLERVIDE